MSLSARKFLSVSVQLSLEACNIVRQYSVDKNMKKYQKGIDDHVTEVTTFNKIQGRLQDTINANKGFQNALSRIENNWLVNRRVQRRDWCRLLKDQIGFFGLWVIKINKIVRKCELVLFVDRPYRLHKGLHWRHTGGCDRAGGNVHQQPARSWCHWHPL